MKLGAWLKVGKINKGEELFRVEVLLKGGQGSFCNETFYKNLIQMPKVLC